MKQLLVIGGSKGIGKEVMIKALPTMKVVSISRTPSGLHHENLTEYHLDVLTDQLPDLEALDYLVYCPGSINLKPITRLSIDDFKNDFEINVIGAIKTIQKYIPLLKQSNNSSVVLFSTVASKLGMPFHSSIAVSKSGVEGLTKSLAAEYASVIRFNAIAPTITNTALSSKILRNESMISLMKERHPLKKILEPEEVAAMTHFLLSDAASGLSGQIFQMDCGITTLKI